MSKVLSLLAGCMVMLSVPAQAAEEGSINVKTTGLNNSKGVMRIALYKDKDSFAADKGDAAGAFKKTVAEIKENAAEATFSDVPFGTYAIKVFHDEDNSGTFYSGMFGMPKVQYGFSNNAKAMFGPPGFDKAKFQFSAKDLKVDIKLQGN